MASISHHSSSRYEQKLNRETLEMNVILQQICLTEIYRLLHPDAKDYAFNSAEYGSFSEADDFLGHKTNHPKLRKTEMIPWSI